MNRRVKSGAGFVGATQRKGGLARQPLDFYPTPEEAAVAFLIAEIERIRPIVGRGKVAEFASGADDLVRVLEAFGLPVVASDLAPRGRGEAIDFLGMKRRPARAGITNPPFDHAYAFIRQAARLRFDYLALLLKTTFFSTKAGYALAEWWRPTTRYDLTWRVDFLLGGSGRAMLDLSWFVWIGPPSPFRPDTVARLLPRPGRAIEEAGP